MIKVSKLVLEENSSKTALQYSPSLVLPIPSYLHVYKSTFTVTLILFSCCTAEFTQPKAHKQYILCNLNEHYSKYNITIWNLTTVWTIFLYIFLSLSTLHSELHTTHNLSSLSPFLLLNKFILCLFGTITEPNTHVSLSHGTTCVLQNYWRFKKKTNMISQDKCVSLCKIHIIFDTNLSIISVFWLWFRLYVHSTWAILQRVLEDCSPSTIIIITNACNTIKSHNMNKVQSQKVIECSGPTWDCPLKTGSVKTDEVF